MSLKPRVDGEASGGGVHAGNVLAVVDVLGGQLVAVIPVNVFVMLIICFCLKDSLLDMSFASKVNE